MGMMTDPTGPALARPDGLARKWIGALVGVWLLLVFIALRGGPALGDHEVIVAQIARQTLQSGDWILLQYLDTPFLVKPPLPVWAVAACSWIAAPSGAAGSGVNDLTARVPSVVAGLLTILVVWRLGRSMFGTRGGVIAALAYGSSLGCLLFSLNVTAEAWLTLFCTWAMAECWWARQATSAGGRFLHLARFYCAFGLAMLAKGPMPLMVTALPLVVWWFAERPMRLLSAGGATALGRSALLGLREAPIRSLQGFTKMGAWWGLPLACLFFIPWMLLVAGRAPYAWDLWRYEYLDRAAGSYPGERPGNMAYYLPIVAGLMLPWALSLPEALVAVFLRTYRRFRAPLFFCWCWAVVAVACLSLMDFKKPYYVLPAAPALALLLAPVLERFFFRAAAPAWLTLRHGLLAGWTIAIVAGVIAWFFAQREFTREWYGVAAWGSPLLVLAAGIGFSIAALWYSRARPARSLFTVGLTFAVVFVATWRLLGPSLSNIDVPIEIAHGLDKAKVPVSTPLYWASNRPDGRLTFYCGRPLRQIVDPYRLIAERGKSVRKLSELRDLTASKLCDLLNGPSQVCCVMQREDFQLLMSLMKPRAQEVFSVDRGKVGRDEDDWVVIRN